MRTISNLQGISELTINSFLNLLNPQHNYNKYSGTAEEICLSVVEQCWNGTFFQAGEGERLKHFWIRDFGWCCESLLLLGYKQEIRRNLKWVLACYEKNGFVSTTLLKSGRGVDVFSYGVDSLPWLLHSLKVSKNLDLITPYTKFLNREITFYYNNVLDTETSLVSDSIYFSEPKDVMKRKRTAVANTFMIFLKDLLEEIEILDNPFSDHELLNVFIDSYWNGVYFINDLENDSLEISSDANVWPYWLGVIHDKKMFKSSIDSIITHKLDKPFPLKYHTEYLDSSEYWINTLLLPNYQGNSIWTLHGPLFIGLVFNLYPKKAKRYLNQYCQQIEKYQTYVEVFEPDGHKPLKGRFGMGSEKGMLWAATVADLVSKQKK